MSANMPKEAGIYWARSRRSMEWYDLVVEVGGMAPFLKIDKVIHRSNTSSSNDVIPWMEWGPKIKEPEVPKSEVVK
jgi:hypothetical protein